MNYIIVHSALVVSASIPVSKTVFSLKLGKKLATWLLIDMLVI